MTDPSFDAILPSFDAILWDFDGTIVDTEGIWLEEELIVAERFGCVLPERFWEETVGGSVIATCEYFCARTDRDVTPQEMSDVLIARMVTRLRDAEPPWLPGSRELIAAAHDAGIPQAVVSASWRDIMEPTLGHLPDGAIGAVVAGDEVAQSKPHPEPYLTAAAKLGVDPTRCLAIEDSPTGSASANAAGAAVLAAGGVLPPPPAPRRVSRASLQGLDLDGLRAIYREAEGVR